MNRPTQTIRAFTLIELLAVMGVIAILGVVITTSAQRISKDAKVAGATNKVLAALGEARAIAIRDRATVLVGFTVRRPTYRATSNSPETIDYSKPQQTEIVIAKATGRVGFPGAATTGSWTVVYPAAAIDDLLLEEFQPVAGMAPMILPAGIKVAGSAADIGDINEIGQDDYWLSQPALQILPTDPVIRERGTTVVVRFAQDGSMQTRNPSLTANLTSSATDTSSVAPWIDFNRNGVMEIGTTGGSSNGKFYALDEIHDESLGDHAMFLAVFDDDLFHSQATPAELAAWNVYTGIDAWMNGLNKARSNFINQFSDRIHFNRFTGVAEIVPR